MSSPECTRRAQFKAVFEQLNSDVIQPVKHDLQRLASSIQEMSNHASSAVPAFAPTPPATSPPAIQVDTSVEAENMASPPQLPAVLAQASDIDATATSHLVAGH